MKRILWYLAFVLLWMTTSWAVTVTVPGDFATINSAIDNCASGDTIRVDPGTYEEVVYYDAKDLVIIGDVVDPSTTVIDAMDNPVAVQMASNLTSEAVLAGFQITGAEYLVYASLQSNPTVRNCILSNATGYPISLGQAGINLSDNDYVDNAIEAIRVSGSNQADINFTNDGIPYHIYGMLQIWGYNGDPIPRLTIDPGTELLFANESFLFVGSAPDRGGELFAVGSPAEPILFGSLTGVAGGWGGIVFEPGSDYMSSESRMEYCNIDKAGGPGFFHQAGIQLLLTRQPTFLNSQISNCASYAIWLDCNSNFADFDNITLTNNVGNSIAVDGSSGMFNEDITYDSQGIPYDVIGDIRVWSDAGSPNPRLTIAPGNTIMFGFNSGLQIGSTANQGGELYAVGTYAEPIVFTACNGQPGGWDGIYFADGSDYGTSTSTIEFCIIEYAGNTGWTTPAGILCDNTDQPTITNTMIRDCDSHAVWLQDTAMIPMTDNVITGNTYDAIGVSGRTISESLTWPRNDVPYHVVDTIYILNTNDPPYPTLTIEPGTVLLFDEDAGLQIGGSETPAQLTAVGTEQLPITMSSFSGDPGGWSGIYFYSGGNGVESTMDWCNISCAGLDAAGFGFTANMCCLATSQPTITNCSFTHSSATGLRLAGYSGSITDTQVCLNADDGIYAWESAAPLVRVEMIGNGGDGIELQYASWCTIGSEPDAVCQIFNNGGYNVRIAAGTDSVSARYNYWGSLDPDEIEASIYDELDNPGLGKVQWAPAVDIGQGLDVTITTTPYHAPILIGPAGGYFRFAAQIQSQEIFQTQIDAWTEFILPNGSTYGPVDLYEGLNMPAGATINAAPFQEMPGYAPAGTYHFVSKVGMYPTARDSSSFEVLKIEYPAAQRWFQGWQTFGWFGDDEFDEEAALAMLEGGELSTELLPTEFEVGEVYPNPFNSSTIVEVALPEPSDLMIAVFNTLGQEVARLTDGPVSAGTQVFTFDASNLASGLYFVRVNVPGQLDQVQKVMLVR